MSKIIFNKLKIFKPFIDVVYKNAFNMYIIGMFGTFILSCLIFTLNLLFHDIRLVIASIIIIYIKTRKTRIVLINDIE